MYLKGDSMLPTWIELDLQGVRTCLGVSGDFFFLLASNSSDTVAMILSL